MFYDIITNKYLSKFVHDVEKLGPVFIFIK